VRLMLSLFGRPILLQLAENSGQPAGKGTHFFLFFS